MKNDAVYPSDAMRERFEAVEICGVPGLFTTDRVSRATVPKNLYAYDLQTSEDDWSQPALLGKRILVEHFGTVIAAQPIALSETGYRDLSDGDFVWPSPNERPTVAEFAEKHGIELQPPAHKKAAVHREGPTR